MDNDKIYIIVPVYKVEPYLERCVDSILKQTYTNWELVLVDDGSPDNCPAICDRYAAEHGNITVIHQDNGGVSAARNTGIEYALKHGDLENNWINFIDSDDFVHPCYLEYLYRAAKEAGTDVSSCKNIRTESSTTVLSATLKFEYKCIAPEEYLSTHRIHATVAWGKLYKLFLFNEIRYPRGKIFEDEFTTYKLIFQYTVIAVIDPVLYYWYLNPNSITSSVWNPNRMDVFDALDEQIVFFNENGYRSAYRASVDFLYWSGIKQHMLIRGLSPKYNAYLPKVKQWQKYAFSLFTKEFGYKKAFSYWFEIRFLHPMKSVLKNESIFSFLKRRIHKKLHIR